MVQAEGIMTERAKITVLVENTADAPGLFAEHSLALPIDVSIILSRESL